MASNRQTRKQIATYLASHGPVDDPMGRATAKLRTAVEYQGSAAGFTQLLAAMERSGELTRTTKGKRTFRIEGATSVPAAEPFKADVATLGATQMDYEQLAAALLVRVVESVSTGSNQSAETDSWARRRIERLERQNAELERAVARMKAELRVLTEERDALKSQLERTAGNLELLTDRMQSRPTHDALSKRLGTDEQALLHQLRNGASRKQGNRVG